MTMEDRRIILYNFASRSRPDRCRRAIQTIMRLSTQRRYKILLKVDDDDEKKHRYPILQAAHGRTIFGKSQSKVHAINRDIPETGWDIIVNMSDDILFTKQGFDDVIRNHTGPDDFVLFPEPYAARDFNRPKNGLISVVSIMGKEYYRRDGYIYHPSYLRTHCDNEATEVAKIRGRFKQVDIQLFFHEHPAAGYKVGDRLYALEKKTWDFDEAKYFERKENNFHE